MKCFHCGREIELTGRLGFRETCSDCGRFLHVCLNCDFYDPTFNNQCREPQAERVVDKDRANFCENFVPQKASEPGRLAPSSDARTKLEALFKKKTQR
jgi:hypothetical protein